MTLLSLPARPSPIALIPAREDSHVARACRTGQLTRVMRGVYASTAEWAALAPWDRFLARTHAAAVRYPDAVFCLESAAALHGLPLIRDPGPAHVLSDGDDRSRSFGAITLHTTTDPRATVDLGGIRCTTLAETVVDIARARHEAIALAVADAALRLDPTITVEMLTAVNGGRASSRNRRRALWSLHRASASPESPLESIDRAVIEWLGYPEPELQVPIGPDRVDKWWGALRIAGEGDGDLKYDGRYGDPRTILRDRHARDARLFAHGVRAVPHWGWPETVGVEPLDAILRSAGLPVVRPRDHARLHSLRRMLGTAQR